MVKGEVWRVRGKALRSSTKRVPSFFWLRVVRVKGES